MQIKYYEKYFPQEAKELRKAFFMEESGFKEEFDNMDVNATHIVLYNDKKEAVAACRTYRYEETNTYILGRLALKKEYRHLKVAHAMVMAAENYAADKGADNLAIHAQCSAVWFYRHHGFRETGEDENDDVCPHRWMIKGLGEQQEI